MNLELLAMRWLRWEKRCAVVVTERSPREIAGGRPDVLGITKDRYTIEIEVKRSLSDFRADARKASRNPTLRDEWRMPKLPKQFYYLVPNELAFKVNGELPDWAGLMRGPGADDIQCVHVVKPSPVNRASLKLTLKECGHVVHLMASQIITLANNCESIYSRRFEDDGWDGWQREYIPGYNNFQI